MRIPYIFRYDKYKKKKEISKEEIYFQKKLSKYLYYITAKAYYFTNHIRNKIKPKKYLYFRR